jgi:hypothetical protein
MRARSESVWRSRTQSVKRLCGWFREHIPLRSPSHELPEGMPETFEGGEVIASRKGDGAYICFTPPDTFHERAEGMPVVLFECFRTRTCTLRT